MKKLLVVLLCLAQVFLLSACSAKGIFSNYKWLEDLTTSSENISSESALSELGASADEKTAVEQNAAAS